MPLIYPALNRRVPVRVDSPGLESRARLAGETGPEPQRRGLRLLTRRCSGAVSLLGLLAKIKV